MSDQHTQAASFRFRVRFDGLSTAGFAECSGLKAQTEFTPYREGGINRFAWQLPGPTTFGPITLRRGVVDRDVWDWYDDVTKGKIRFLGGTIALLDEAGAASLVEWAFQAAIPSRWQGPELNAAQSNVAV